MKNAYNFLTGYVIID